MISIILIEPETPGNIGALARVMKNFDLNKLILVNPKCDPLSKEALDRSTHAKDILKKAKIIKKFPTNFDYLIATTSRLGTDYNLPRSPLIAEQLADKLKKINTKKIKIGLVFGRESAGLTNEEIDKCDFSVSIPTSTKFPVMNISHAATIIFYELFKNSKNKKIGEQITPISKKEKDVILNYINKALNKLKFSTKEKKQTQKTLWKRIIGKSFLTKREAFALCGFFRKIK